MRVSGPTCVYIASRGHSGSTLLEVLLGRHPDVASSGEVANLGLQCFRDEGKSWKPQCGCGALPLDCPVWGEILDRIEQTYGVDMRKRPLAFKVSDIGLEDERYAGLASHNVPLVAVRKKLWRLLRLQQYAGPRWLSGALKLYEPQRQWARNRSFVLQTFAEIQDVPVVIDSSKDPLGMRDLYDFSPLRVKILFLTRDCRGNVWSFSKRGRFAGQDRKETIGRAAHAWVAVNRRIHRLLEPVPGEDWMHVRYEDLCANPGPTLETIFDFIGVARDARVLQNRPHIEHTIAGNRIRFTNTQATIREDTAWRENLDGPELELISEIAAPLARKLGYQL